jgi:hypothetical protein
VTKIEANAPDAAVGHITFNTMGEGGRIIKLALLYSWFGSRAPTMGNAIKWRDFLGLESTHKD